MKKGFTLIELLVFIAIFSAIIGSLITIFIAILNIQTNQTAAAEVNQQSQFVLQQIQYYVSSARIVDMAQDTATSSITVRTFSPTTDPTIVTVSSGTLYLQQGVGNALQAITSNKVAVSQFSATRHFNVSTSSAPYGTDSVSFSFTMSATSTNNKQYSQSFQSSVATFAPVGKIAMVQQASAVSNNPSVASLAATYLTNNETSSLLVAVVANTANGASVSIADGAGNTWNKIANVPYAAYNEELNIFAALNAKNSSNTVTATFGAGAGYVSLFLYEYRGASTVSSFDASSSQLQPNMQTPSSGSANPTSTVELLLGANYNGTTAEIPVAGTGFTMETSSTVSHVFVEDTTQYVTGPVAASWQYSGTTPSSSALIVTFR